MMSSLMFKTQPQLRLSNTLLVAEYLCYMFVRLFVSRSLIGGEMAARDELVTFDNGRCKPVYK